jgi:hypothetical protein
MAKLRQVSREPLWLTSVGQGAIVRAEITRWRLPHDLVRRPGRTFSIIRPGHLQREIIRPGHLQREPPGVVERHVPAIQQRRWAVDSSNLMLFARCGGTGLPNSRSSLVGSLRSLLDMVSLGKQQVGGISQPRGAVDHKGSLEGQPIDREHVGQIAQELRRIDFAQA